MWDRGQLTAGANRRAFELLGIFKIVNFWLWMQRGCISLPRIIGIVFVALFVNLLMLAMANAEKRSLKLYYLHTGEKATITYKKNGKYLPVGLKRVNIFLRDWRRNEPTRMDPKLLDLVWEVYRQSGSRDYIHVISGYRSPATNNMLRKRGRGVAKRSQHTLGKALDFFLPDVRLAKLRKIGLLKQVGGVGYYPRSGSPFVHIDTGSVRHWPRMSRKQLVRIFPNGKTLHIPTDGKPLPGYNQAVARYNARKSSGTKLASAKGTEKERKSFFARLASLGNNEDDDSRSNNLPLPKKVKTTSKKSSLSPIEGPLQAQNITTVGRLGPDLPLLASVPVPRIAPRNSFDGQISNNAIIARLNNQNNPGSLDKLANIQPAPNSLETAFAAPVPQNRPAANSNLLALAKTDQAAIRTTQIGTNRSNNNDLNLEPVTTNHLRNQLIAQANDQLRTSISNPPRPTASIGPKFKTAFVASGEERLKSRNPLLTRSFENKSNDGGTLSSFDQNAAVQSFVFRANRSNNDIAVPAKRPKLVARYPNNLRIAGLTSSANNSKNRNRQLARLENETDQYSGKSISNMILAAIPNPARHRSELHSMPNNINANASDRSINGPFNEGLRTNDSQIKYASLQDREYLQPLSASSQAPLDDLSIAWYEQKRTAKFVLENTKSIKATDKLRAPAYGRAAIRQSPKTVLTAGFIPTAAVQNSTRFTPGVNQFQAFTKYN